MLHLISRPVASLPAQPTAPPAIDALAIELSERQEGMFIDREDWSDLNPDDQQFVTAALASRRLSLYSHPDRLSVVSTAQLAHPPQWTPINSPYHFYCEDSRLPHSDRCRITVEALDRAEAWSMLGEFLEALSKTGAERGDYYAR